MERTEMADLWDDMWKEGNWIPSIPDSLAKTSAEQAAWTPGPLCRSIWQEVVHLIFWRNVTLSRMAGGPSPSAETVLRDEFAAPQNATQEAWEKTISELKRTQTELAAAIINTDIDVSRMPYHLVHDAYHLGRITQLRAMQGAPPKF